MMLYRKIITSGVIIAFMLAFVSCNRQKPQSKPVNVPVPAGHEKMVEAYKKSVAASHTVVVAKVNGNAITMFALINEMNSIGPLYVKPGQKLTPEIDSKVRKVALDRLILRELAIQEAMRQGMRADPRVVDAQLKRAQAAPDYKQKLAFSGLSEDWVRKQIERGMLLQMITEKEIVDMVKIDPAQLKKIYEKEKASFRSPDGKQLSFEEVRPRIEEELKRPLLKKRENQWLDGLKKAAKIEITLDQSAKEIHGVQ